MSPEPDREQRAYANFEAALRQLVQEHMPWPYTDVDRFSDEANDHAWAVAKKYAHQIWGEVRP